MNEFVIIFCRTRCKFSTKISKTMNIFQWYEIFISNSHFSQFDFYYGIDCTWFSSVLKLKLGVGNKRTTNNFY